jgi:cysteinyl-tRNA synthetase
MKLYNTLSRSIEDIQPQNAPEITVYTCGPTVYDYPHIGNWFTFIRYDLLIRALRSAGLKSKWIMNITDVGHLVSDEDEGEDKLEKGAKREGKTAWEIAQFYADYFNTGLTRLNILQPDLLPKATDHITEQITLVKILEAKGYTYTITDGVYFDTTKLNDYGKLARLDIENLREGARVEANPEKHSPTDFALWKLTPVGQKRDMEWDSRWGKGFPGWHLECSAMSMKYLGETIDLHAGGIDHIPVHHTNEIAQSESATGKQFSKYWMHTNHITVDGQKISKSLGNGITLEDIEDKGFSLMALRMLVLESHYRSQAQFTWDVLKAAQTRFHGWQATVNLEWQMEESDDKDVIEIIRSTLQEDLNTPRAIAEIDSYFNKLLNETAKAPNKKVVEFIEDTLGIKFDHQDINEEDKELLNERAISRKEQNWQKSDSIREELKARGLGISDSPVGQIWYRV